MSNQTGKPKRNNPPPWILAGIVLALMAVLILLQSSNVWKTLGVETANDTLTLYALSTLNFIAFIIFAFILLRSLLKLSRERKTFQIGAKIKTRLLTYFVSVSLLPILAMFVFSYLFMNRALERWFSQIPENVVREARNVNQNKFNETARMLAKLLESQPTNNQILTDLANEGNLTHLEIIAEKGEILAQSERNSILEGRQEEFKVFMSFIRANQIPNADLNDGKGFEAAIVSMSDNRKLIVVPDWRPEANVSQIADNSLAEFDRLKKEQVTIRQIGLSTLGVLTFLLIFAASWVAFYIARGLTVPIKALAEGSDEIARGNLAHRVEVLAEDELETLVTAFNQMSDRLEASSHELKERRRYIETVLQSLSTGVISFDAEDNITTINKSAIQMLKLEDANFHNLPLSKLVGTENFTTLEKLLNRAKRIGLATEQTVLMREYADGSEESGESIPVALTATSLPDKNGVVLVIEDLTELIHAQRATAWQEVARRMAHEIKNPLTPIQLSAERIAKKIIQNNQTNGENKNVDEQKVKVVKEGTETILREVAGLKAMVDEFSRFSRLPNIKLENGNINEIVKQVIGLYEDRQVRIEADLQENLSNSMLDGEQLKRVFVNLVENSLEAFNKNQVDKVIQIKTFDNVQKGLTTVEISDNGNGIEAQNFAKLFQPYFSTKGRGTGLGLAIVQRIINEHGGKIRAVSNFPTGAKFIVELPMGS